MSDLIVIGYENPQTAHQAYEQVQRLQRDFIVDLRGLAIVDVDADGKTHVHTPQRIIGMSAATGAIFGGTILKTSLSEDDEKELAEELAGRG